MDSPVLTAVSPVEAPRNPWGMSKVHVSSLACVMDEELAKEMDKNEKVSSWEDVNVEPPVEGMCGVQ